MNTNDERMAAVAYCNLVDAIQQVRLLNREQRALLLQHWSAKTHFDHHVHGWTKDIIESFEE